MIFERFLWGLLLGVRTTKGDSDVCELFSSCLTAIKWWPLLGRQWSRGKRKIWLRLAIVYWQELTLLSLCSKQDGSLRERHFSPSVTWERLHYPALLADCWDQSGDMKELCNQKRMTHLLPVFTRPTAPSDTSVPLPFLCCLFESLITYTHIIKLSLYFHLFLSPQCLLFPSQSAAYFDHCFAFLLNRSLKLTHLTASSMILITHA